jgi:hypothetical protein
LIANAFLEAEIDRLSAAVSSGFESKVLLRDASALVECGAVGRRQYRSREATDRLQNHRSLCPLTDR